MTPLNLPTDHRDAGHTLSPHHRLTVPLDPRPDREDEKATTVSEGER